MQFQLSILAAAALATVALAAATPARDVLTGTPPPPPPQPASQCNTGPIQCCDSVQTADSDAASKALALVGVVVQDPTVLVGLTCNPITVIGGGGNSCSAQPVCCTNNTFSGLVVIGCTPVNLNL